MMPRSARASTLMKVARVAVCMSGAAMGAPSLAEQPGSPAPTPPAVGHAPSTEAFARVTRADLAHLYLRFERAMASSPPAESRLAEINRAFDAASLEFFSGAMGRVVEKLNALRLSVESPGRVTPLDLFAASLKVELDPPVLALSTGEAGTLRVAPMYAAAPAEGARVRVRDASGREIISRLIPGTPEEISIYPGKLGLQPGLLRVEIVAGERQTFERRWAIVDHPLDRVREAVLDALRELDPADPALAQALATCRARAGLLVDRPSDTNSAEFLADPVVLAPEVERESREVLASRDPYRRLAGDLWRVVRVGTLDVPVRVYAPRAACGDDMSPLLVALHGAGGDESMFFEGYGDGVIRALAEKHGMIVAAPLTTMVMGNPRVFDSIVDAIALTHAVDRRRIYVIGHSLGAGATAGIATQRAGAIAAAACLAGFARFDPAVKIPPMLIIAGELDPLAPAARVEPGIRRAIAGGLPITYRALAGRGHTLMVGQALPEVFEWLSTHRLAAP